MNRCFSHMHTINQMPLLKCPYHVSTQFNLSKVKPFGPLELELEEEEEEDMELELELKITHTKDDLTSSTDLRIAKDPFGHVFCSKETKSVLILIIHLKGFRRENIEIEINKEGNRIAISGKKAVEEMALKRWIMWKKEVELRAFRKVFRIPDVVDLDRIKAKFNEEESTLKIIMPKKVKGICGLKIEEDKEVEEDKRNSKSVKTQTEDDYVPDRASTGEAIQETGEEPKIENMEETGQESPEEQAPEEKGIESEIGDRIEEATDEIKPTEDNKETNGYESQEEEKKKDLNEGATPKKKSKRPKLCAPCVFAGSAFLFTLIVIIIRLIRSKKI